MFIGGYQPDVDDGVLYSVLIHPKGHADLPKAFFQIDGMDPLRDEGLIYERVLREEYSIPTRLNVYPGLPHGHWAIFPMLKSADLFRREQVAGMGWVLDREPDLSAVNFDAHAASV